MELRRPNSQYSINYSWCKYKRFVLITSYASLTCYQVKLWFVDLKTKMLSTVDSNVMSTSKLQLFGSVLLFTGVPALLLNPFLRDWTKNNAVQQFWRRPILFMFRFFYLVQKYVELLIIRQCQKSKIRQMWILKVNGKVQYSIYLGLGSLITHLSNC